MLTEAEIERERYEARLKAQLDHNSLMKASQRYREQGLEEGLRKGELIGAVHLCQRLLNLPVTPTSELTLLSLDELARLAEEFQAKVMSPRSSS